METNSRSILTKSSEVFKGMYDFDEEQMNRISYRLQYHMKKDGLSCAKLSRLAGCNRDTIRRYADIKYEENAMDILILKRIAKVFELDQYYFCNDYQIFVDSTDIRDFLRSLRKQKSYTQKGMAAKLDLLLSNYKAYEQGKVKIPYEIYKKIESLK